MKLRVIKESRETDAIDLIRAVISGTEYEGKVFIAGGYVRDEVLGGTPKDIDLVIDRPNGGIEFATFFAKKLGIREPVIFQRFGTAKISLSGQHRGSDLTGVEIECVAPRAERYDPDSRKPSTTFGTMAQDVERRDFTVNSLLKNVTTGEVVDLTGRGMEDLRAGIIRTPTDPNITFSDDPLRMLRAVRFSVKFGWKFAEGLEAAITKNASRLSIISKERIRDEFEKMLVSKDPVGAIKTLMRTGLMPHINKQLSDILTAMIGMEQNRHHIHDVFGHVMAVLEASSPRIAERLAALFHDAGKPATRMPHPTRGGEYQFLGHEDESVRIAEAVMKDLRFPGDLIEKVCASIAIHMNMKDPRASSDKSLRKWARAAGLHRDTAIDLLRADSHGHCKDEADRAGIDDEISYLRGALERVSSQPEVAAKRRGVVTGDDLMSVFGLKPGPDFRRYLEFAQDLEDGGETNREVILQAIKKEFNL